MQEVYEGDSRVWKENAEWAPGGGCCRKMVPIEEAQNEGGNGNSHAHGDDGAHSHNHSHNGGGGCDHGKATSSF